MTVGDWLREREPAPPARLSARIDAALRTVAGQSDAAPFGACLRGSETLLREVAGRESPGRESALDLLAADALATYALEAAADDPSTLDAEAREAMKRLAAIAGE